MKGHLLIDVDSFRWENLEEDRKIEIESLETALNLAIEHGDTVFGHPKIWDIKLNWGFFYDILYWDEEERMQKMPWLTDIPLSILTQLFNYYKPSDAESETLQDLNKEFKAEWNGLLGLPKKHQLIQNCVYDEQTWYHWHRSYFILNPPLRSEFCTSLLHYFPNLYLNESSVKSGLADLHTDYKEIMATILYHLALLNDVYYRYAELTQS